MYIYFIQIDSKYCNKLTVKKILVISVFGVLG